MANITRIELHKMSSLASKAAAVYVVSDLDHVKKICELLDTLDTVWTREQIESLVVRATKGEFDMRDCGHTVVITLKEAREESPSVHPSHPTIAEFSDFLLSSYKGDTLVGVGDDIPRPLGHLNPETVEFIDLGLALQRYRNEQDALLDLKVSAREHATILAALRLYQASDLVAKNIVDIATDGGSYEPLDDIEIDDLCAKID